jgi:nitroreductase/dihydropteridine reductase
MELLEALQWRYATKKMNGQKVPSAMVDNIIEAARLAPTSSGLQPFQILVITDITLKEAISKIAFGQSQVNDCSHLLVFAAWDKFTEERIDAFFERSNTERGLPLNTTDDYKGLLKAQFGQMSDDEHYQQAAKQAYIAFSTAIVAAAMQKIDATPMEGFDKHQLDELLGLKALGLKSATMLAIGYRDEANDWLVNMKKVRTPKASFIIEK